MAPPRYADILTHMRTTMNLPADLYRAVRIRAAEEGRTVTSMMEQALRTLLEAERVEAEPYRVRPLTMGQPGEPPVDVNDNAAVRALLDAADPEGIHANS